MFAAVGSILLPTSDEPSGADPDEFMLLGGYPANPLRRIGAIELSLILAPISAAFCNRAVAEVKAEPIAIGEIFDPSAELKHASEVLGFSIGFKLLDIVIPVEFKDNGIRELSMFSSDIVRFIIELFFEQESELGIVEVNSSCT